MKKRETLTNMLEGFESLEGFAAGLNLSFLQKLKLRLTLVVVSIYRVLILPLRKKKSLELKNGLSTLTNIDLKINRIKFPEGSENHYLNEAQIQQFEQKGVLGPFQVMSQAEAAKLKEQALAEHDKDFGGKLFIGKEIEQVLKKHKQWTINYSGFYQALQLERFRKVLQSPQVSQRIASILGEEVICWRNQFFQKNPGSNGTFWHQTSSFREQAKTSKLVPTQPVSQPIVQLTVWIALTDVTKKNGALRIIPGSFKDGRIEYLQGYAQDNLIDFLARQKPKRLPVLVKAALFSTGAFVRSQALFETSWDYLDDPFKNLEIQDLVMKAGEAVVFTSLNMHGSFPNSSSTDSRLAFAGRITANHVKVFPGVNVSYLGTPEGTKPIPLDDISNIQIHGKDSFGFNKIFKG